MTRDDKIAELHKEIYDLPDCGELYPVRRILSDIVALIEIHTAEPEGDEA